MPDYTTTVMVRGDECPYDPEAEIAQMYCDKCGQPNEVPVYVDGDEVSFQGFVCEHCGQYNAPE